MKKILLVDDHTAVRKGLMAIIEGSLPVSCNEASCCREASLAMEEVKYDLVMLDLSLDKDDGLSILPVMKDKCVPAIVYSMHENSRIIRQSLDAGASAYVCKRENSAVLLNAIQVVLSGKSYLSPLAAQFLSQPMAGECQLTVNPLSARERQVLYLLGNGHSNAEIAISLGVTIKTIETYYCRMISKMDFKGMHELRQFAIKDSQKRVALHRSADAP